MRPPTLVGMARQPDGGDVSCGRKRCERHGGEGRTTFPSAAAEMAGQADARAIAGPPRRLRPQRRAGRRPPTLLRRRRLPGRGGWGASARTADGASMEAWRRLTGESCGNPAAHNDPPMSIVCTVLALRMWTSSLHWGSLSPAPVATQRSALRSGMARCIPPHAAHAALARKAFGVPPCQWPTLHRFGLTGHRCSGRGRRSSWVCGA